MADPLQAPRPAGSSNTHDQLHQQGRALADLRVEVAEMRKDVQIHAERQREINDAIKSIAQSLQELTAVAVKTEHLQEDLAGMVKTIHGERGIKEVQARHHDRLRTVELWISGMKFVVAPAVGAILIKEALRLWGG